MSTGTKLVEFRISGVSYWDNIIGECGLQKSECWDAGRNKPAQFRPTSAGLMQRRLSHFGDLNAKVVFGQFEGNSN